jgi:hypothetical protein
VALVCCPFPCRSIMVVRGMGRVAMVPPDLEGVVDDWFAPAWRPLPPLLRHQLYFLVCRCCSRGPPFTYSSSAAGEDLLLPSSSKRTASMLSRFFANMAAGSQPPKALLWSGHGCSNPFYHEVIRSPWRKGRPWLQIVAGRGLPSSWPLLLGGDASRMPARGGEGAQGLDCKLNFCSRVLFCKKIRLSLYRKSPRDLKRLFLHIVPNTFNRRKFRSFLDPFLC